MDQALLDARVASLDTVVATALGDLAGWLDTLGAQSPEWVTEQLRSVVPVVVEGYGDVAATLAADWYTQVRPVGARTFVAQPVVPEGLAEQADGLVSWAAKPLIVDGDRGQMFTHLSGGVQRLVADFDRETVMVCAERDPAALGWRRRASGDACAFCAYMAMASPDEVGADARKFHSHCHCQSVPMFSADDDLAQPDRDRYEGAIEKARERLIERRDAIGYNRLKRDKRPRELALTTRNILAGMREQGYR